MWIWCHRLFLTFLGILACLFIIAWARSAYIDEAVSWDFYWDSARGEIHRAALASREGGLLICDNATWSIDGKKTPREPLRPLNWRVTPIAEKDWLESYPSDWPGIACAGINRQKSSMIGEMK